LRHIQQITCLFSQARNRFLLLRVEEGGFFIEIYSLKLNLRHIQQITRLFCQARDGVHCFEAKKAASSSKSIRSN
ncbi:MAG: hypothetical protein IKC61_03555, partial [Clostridia bacterium]|nr:hypothetical protein [Clostridia bacterium]